MKILGLDFGMKKIGCAISEGFLAEPWAVIHYSYTADALNKLQLLINKESVEKVVVGISEGESALRTKTFAADLKSKISIPVDFQDETLSTQEAQQKAWESGMTRKKRKGMEDAFAAAVILQNYLDKQ